MWPRAHAVSQANLAEMVDVRSPGIGPDIPNTCSATVSLTLVFSNGCGPFVTGYSVGHTPVYATRIAESMSTTNKTVVVSGALVIALSVSLGIQWRMIRAVQGELSALRDSAAEASRLKEESARLARMNVEAAEIDRFARERSGLLRLRDEVGQLRQQLRSGAGQYPQNVTGSEAEVTASDTSGDDTLGTYTARVTARVASGDTMVTGGWATAPGRRSLVFITPVIDTANPEAGEVSVRLNEVDVPEDALRLIGRGDFVTDRHESSLQTVLSEQEASSYE